ncbi:sucrase ferredoxin [Gordonia sp. HNM0687]|uniref:Sucrase ferredoxin n=1 Tax=Gordonia mangrovi TaxID=2665643 RepID=A0A6L7GNM8_9ACTN|nr:sucrase ferredoxin [Gordonia mangrovi]MXP21203.1 sucrase ferredoxin [Gordonia mangrovi]UVF78266.1 sucrase ferredoxin [Gordonia mangrovi]
MTDRPPCSDSARHRGDPMFGTASAGHRWVLLELAGAWGPSAFLQSPKILDPALGRAIVRRVETAGMRIVAIRRPGRRAAVPRWRWFIVDARPGSETVYRGEVAAAPEFLDLALDGSDGARSDDPLVAVCAHGKHDQCCAVRGRAATAAISAVYPEWTWECSHLGGDRFAATMILYPHGLSYGAVDSADDPAAIVHRYTNGRLDNELLRGRTSLPHAVQAAQYFVRRATGDDRIDALAPIDVRRADHRIEVVLEGSDGPIGVTLAEHMSDPLHSTCAASVAGRVRQFVLVAMTRVTA